MASQQNPSGNPNTLVNTFMEITSSTAEEAQFFLESHNFDVDAAVETFFESTSIAASPSAATATATVPSAATETATVPSSDADSHFSGSVSPSPSPSRSRSHSPPPADSGIRSQYNLRSRRPNADNGDHARSGRIRTFSDLNRSSAGDGSGSDSDPDHPPQYFTGGQKSGMLVQDPSKLDDVDAFFEQARRMGAMEGPADVFQPSSSSRSFTGTARLLSGEMVSSAPHEQPPEAVTHTITFWRNGFTVNDGPLRRFHDPENASFLESIKNSECPKELEPADRRTSVRVNLVRKDENCLEPEKQQMPFQGVGRTLGTSNSVPSEPSPDATAMNAAPTPVMGLVVDQNLPSTSIQLRLADGTRMVSRFNYHHTIGDIHAFIDASRPGRAGTYALQTVGFPPNKLTELDQTIEQAGLANSVVIQKF